MHWEYKTVFLYYDAGSVDGRYTEFDQGWEPFAVTNIEAEPEFVRVHLRRKVDEGTLL